MSQSEKIDKAFDELVERTTSKRKRKRKVVKGVNVRTEWLFKQSEQMKVDEQVRKMLDYS